MKASDVIKQFNLLQNKSHSKKLGQNFILDTNILDKIVSLSGNVKNENVLEIGSGVGSLSERILLKHPKSLLILEKDPMCIKAVKSWLPTVDIQECDVSSAVIPSEGIAVAEGSSFEIRECDALDIDYETLLKDRAPVKIIANLPYSVASEILVRFCFARHLIKDMTLMFQKEVGERIAAKPGSKDFGRLSVFAQTCFDCRIVKIFPPSIFIPAPKVDSALVHFVPKTFPPVILSDRREREDPKTTLELDPSAMLGMTGGNVDLNKLSKLTQVLFSKRRKMLRHSIPETILLECGIDPKERVENLSLEKFWILAQFLSQI